MTDVKSVDRLEHLRIRISDLPDPLDSKHLTG